ncbi:hypothetical protein EVAR_94120_1 [Eumeta japonica]|uniref:Uncharacterized protein n=1 Tax=Eumeta variegata TaxID=151549 RepID=A0A4C1U6Y1_EUMVA|nr:hypothetical protein EVAR_94120_1 [Eumeta japonica]
MQQRYVGPGLRRFAYGLVASFPPTRPASGIPNYSHPFPARPPSAGKPYLPSRSPDDAGKAYQFALRPVDSRA